MNLISAYLKKTGRMLTATVAVALCCTMTSCDSAIYDYEGDCSVTYRMAFRYDRNMKWADAFANEVKSVHLYAFDKSGILVWQQTDRGDALKSDSYAMTLDLPAGDYRMVAWCGLENDGEQDESFTVPEARVGETRLEELQCSLNRRREPEGKAYSGERLYPLFHGMLDVTLSDYDDGGVFTDTMDLTKDTNHVRIILQQLSGEPVNEKNFTFRIEEENGLMDYDNSLLPDEMITYLAYNVTSGTAGMSIDDYPVAGSEAKSAKQPSSRATITSVSVAIADLTIARLTENRKTYLTIETTDGQTAARIPMTDYALLLKDGYYGNQMSDQEYLDRQDEYTLTFFLDDDRYWIGTSIIINSWKVVLNKVDFGE